MKESNERIYNGFSGVDIYVMKDGQRLGTLQAIKFAMDSASGFLRAISWLPVEAPFVIRIDAANEVGDRASMLIEGCSLPYSEIFLEETHAFKYQKVGSWIYYQ